MNKFESLKSMVEFAEMLSAFYLGLVDNGMSEDCAMDLTMELLHITANGAMEQ